MHCVSVFGHFSDMFEGAPLGAVVLTAPEPPAEFGARPTKQAAGLNTRAISTFRRILMYRPTPRPLRVRDSPPSRVPHVRRYCGLIGFSGARSGPPSLTRKGPPPLRSIRFWSTLWKTHPFFRSSIRTSLTRKGPSSITRKGPPSLTCKGPPSLAIHPVLVYSMENPAVFQEQIGRASCRERVFVCV